MTFLYIILMMALVNMIMSAVYDPPPVPNMIVLLFVPVMMSLILSVSATWFICLAPLVAYAGIGFILMLWRISYSVRCIVPAMHRRIDEMQADIGPSLNQIMLAGLPMWFQSSVNGEFRDPEYLFRIEVNTPTDRSVTFRYGVNWILFSEVVNWPTLLLPRLGFKPIRYIRQALERIANERK